MHPANGNDAWGGFKMGPNGLELYDEDLYHAHLHNEAFMKLVYDTKATIEECFTGQRCIEK